MSFDNPAADIAAMARKKTPANNLWLNFLRHWQLYVIILIPVAYIIIFRYVPMGGIIISFKEYRVTKGIWGSEFSDPALKWFIKFFTTPSARRTISNTIILSVYGLLAGFPFPIFLALLLNEVGSVKFKKTVQMVTYAPYFISTVVFVGLIFQFVDLRTGIVNFVIQFFGGDAINFMGKHKLWRHVYVWTGIYKGVGYGAVIYIAALAGINPELYEAAVIDGASRVQRIWHIDIPGILPTIVILFILNAGRIMTVGFEKAFLMQNDINLLKSEIISTYVYKIGLQQIKYSFSTAVGLFNSLVNLILLSLVNFIARRIGETSLW